MKYYDTIIIGAGIAGLSAGRILKNAPGTVLLIDKGRVPGGRMATRRAGEAVFDHGAQFITVRSDIFQNQMDTWIDSEAAQVWGHGFGTVDGHPRYNGCEGMNRLARTLVDGLEIRLSETVKSIGLHLKQNVPAIENSNDSGTGGHPQWEVLTNAGQYLAKALIITAPFPQTRVLLKEVDIPSEDLTKIDSVEYEACLALLLNLNSKNELPKPGAVQLDSEPIAWIGDNQAKGISTVPALTVHSGPEFAAANWESTDEEIFTSLLPHLSRWLEPNNVSQWQVKRWRYSKPSQPLDESYLRLTAPAPIFLAGDAFMRARVEGAYLSGQTAAQALIAERLGSV